MVLCHRLIFWSIGNWVVGEAYTMSLFGRALTLLKEVNITLNEDLSDIDLMALKASTTEAMDANALARWVRLLEAVSPPLVTMGRELTSAEAFVERRRKATRTIQSMMCTTGSVLTIIVALSVWRMMTVPSLPQKTVGVGMLLCFLLGFFGLIKSWIIMLVERLDRFDDQNDGPVMNALRKYRLTLSNKVIIQYSAAYTTGSGMSTLMDRIANMNNDDVTQTVGARAGCTNPSSTYASGNCEMPIDTCKPIDSLPPLEDAVKRYCRPLMTEMLDRLQEIKLDIDQYDRPLLWRDVDSGVEELRKLIYTQYDVKTATDAASSPGGLTREAAFQILDNEVIPLLSLPAIEISSFRLSNLSAIVSKTKEKQLSKNACWRSCLGDPHCVMAMYDETSSTCLKSEDYAGAIEGGNMAYVSKTRDSKPVLLRQPTADSNTKPVFVCGVPVADISQQLSLMPPNKQGVSNIEACRSDSTCRVVHDSNMWRAAPEAGIQSFISDGMTATQTSTGSGLLAKAAAAVKDATSSSACVKTTVEQLYRTGLATNAAIMMRDQASSLATDIAAVLQRHRYQLSIDSNRSYIDGRLIEHYGIDLYVTLSPIVDEVLLRTRMSVRAAIAAQNTRFIEPARLAAKIDAMSGDEWNLFSAKMKRTLVAVKQHRDFFPAYRNNMSIRMFKALVMYGIFVAMIAYLVFMVLIYHAKHIKSIDGATMVRRIMVSICVFIMTIAVAETTTKKYAVKQQHNFDAIDNNGEMFIGGIGRAGKQLNALRMAALQQKVSGIDAEVKHLSRPTLRDIRNAIESYDRCNFVTTSIAKMPFPTADLALYLVVALVFIGVAGVAVARIGPAERIDNVRRLMSSKARLKRGEISNMTEVVRLIECCQPPELVWDMFMWFGIIMLFVITWWFVFSTRDAVDDYESAIAANPDCVT